MKEVSLDKIAGSTPAAQLARLSGSHGYRFDGDTVQLHAMFALLDPAAHDRAWALQLWACPNAPASRAELAGHVVAEVSLPPMGELADESEHFEVSAFARPPAGTGDFAMVLVLASGRPGQFNEVHDFAVYSGREQFVQPRMTGNVGYRIYGDRVEFMVERVENPRPSTNRSGTLSVELWSLPAPFRGGAFEGRHLAGVEIGCVDGQNEMSLRTISLAFSPPPAGTRYMVMMLREWTANGFVTRDFTNFATPFVTVPAPAPASRVESTPAPVVVSQPVQPVAAKALEAKVEKIATPAPAKLVAAKGVSINNAPVEELAAIKGMNKKIAEGIVKKRPFASLDDLRDVKGVGEKILAKIRSKLRL